MSFDPFALQFYINTRWQVRPDDAESVAQCLRRFLDELIATGDMLSGWLLGRRYIPYASVRDSMEPFVKRNVMIGEDGKPDPKDGFSIQAASGDKRQRFSFVGTAGRLYRYPMANDLYFYTNSNHPADTTIVTYPLIKGVVLAHVTAWQPEFCAAYSSKLKPDAAEGRYRKAWITYVTPQHAGSVDLVGVPFSERTPDGGVLLSATDQTFDATNPVHLAGAQRLYEVTRHLNATLPA